MALSLAIDTKEKRNMAILLGFMAALIVGVLIIYVVLPALSGGGEDDVPAGATAENATPLSAPKAASPVAATGAAPAGAPPAAGAAAGAPAVVPVSSQRAALPFGRPREDPFEPHLVRIPAPPIRYDEERRPPPPPPPPIAVPQPGNMFVAPLPIPGPGSGSISGSISGSGSGMVGLPRPPVLTTLPPVQIPQLVTSPVAPRLQGGVSQPGVVGRASSRRVSGVLIGDSVRAILEIGEGMEKVTRIVQPGDEVDGIRILRIERIREGSRVTTRMIISEAGEERFVELSPSAEPMVGVGPAGGAGAGGFNAPPAPGAFGGAPAGGGNPFGRPRSADF